MRRWRDDEHRIQRHLGLADTDRRHLGDHHDFSEFRAQREEADLDSRGGAGAAARLDRVVLPRPWLARQQAAVALLPVALLFYRVAHVLARLLDGAAGLVDCPVDGCAGLLGRSFLAGSQRKRHACSEDDRFHFVRLPGMVVAQGRTDALGVYVRRRTWSTRWRAVSAAPFPSARPAARRRAGG